ncbi:glycosyltransferase [Roseovarius sp. LXJ103]|uniref:glycosyltransferase n=1 Tax=Roseovarius carneus TaxID=2853164 RepID=UPI000D61BCA4|nr:glycosyltransferase [Roseovarius carneus]MBZ8118206.1 glycosyltransferase [Roseovarius carneus]PWE36067.1 glycosyl transferase [Pelagicola sp. LXJ1103]
MGISELRQPGGTSRARAVPLTGLARDLVESGVISRADADLAKIVQKHCDAPLDRVLVSEGLTDEATILNARAARAGTAALDAAGLAHYGTRLEGIDPAQLVKHALLPLHDDEGTLHIATHNPETLRRAARDLPRGITDLPMMLAPRRDIQHSVANLNRAALTAAAKARVPEAESCRTWRETPYARLTVTLVCLTALALLTVLFPTAVFGIFVGWATLTLLVSAGLKTAALMARIMAGPAEANVQPVSVDQKLPKVSVLVPLFQETEIAHALITRLARLSYPKCLLDVVLVLEENDAMTQKTLAEIDLPPWMRAVIVPDGKPRTKPRAMNYALDFCEGDIIGIFDAEDAPDPDQITQVARRFQAAPPDVVCLQGILDYYNPRQNWLARCFSIEYATWFRIMLPGLARLGFAIPLGGTTLYFRREVLETLGGWDAHNVTEDADLGFRLARHGYRTEVIGTVTGEEAACKPWPWIKQRSRWLKGYMTTYLVHMRQPRLLYRQLGAWKFWGFQAHFVAALSQFMLAPFLWSFWLVLFGLPHPLDPIMPRDVLLAFGRLFLAVEVLNIGIHLMAVSGRFHRHLMPWVPTTHLYTPLGTIAAYKALYELIFAPFFWDKTSHGHSLAHVGKSALKGGFDLARVQLEARHKRF